MVHPHSSQPTPLQALLADKASRLPGHHDHTHQHDHHLHHHHQLHHHRHHLQVKASGEDDSIGLVLDPVHSLQPFSCHTFNLRCDQTHKVFVERLGSWFVSSISDIWSLALFNLK